MKHLKTFESYSPDESLNEEFIGKIIKSILGVPVAAIGLTVMQFMDPRKLKEQILPQFLDIYSNLDVLIDTLENIHFNNKDITDVESEDILKKLNKLKKIKIKYPTLDEYKKKVCKVMPLFNIRNRKYLCDQVMQYEPKKMNASEVMKEIGKVYKEIKRDDIIGDVDTTFRLARN